MLGLYRDPWYCILKCSKRNPYRERLRSYVQFNSAGCKRGFKRPRYRKNHGKRSGIRWIISRNRESFLSVPDLKRGICRQDRHSYAGLFSSLFPDSPAVETNSLKIGRDQAIRSVYRNNTGTKFHSADNNPISLTRITLIPVEGPADEKLS